MVVFLAIMTGYTFATLCYYPWMTLLLNGLALLTLSSVLVTSYLCLTFLGVNLATETTWPSIARVLIILINVAVVALLLMHLVAATKDIVLQYLKFAAELVAAKATRIRGGSSVTAAKRVARPRRVQNASADDLTAAVAAGSTSGEDVSTAAAATVAAPVVPPVRLAASGGVGAVAAPRAGAAAADPAEDDSMDSSRSSTPGVHQSLDSVTSTP